MAAGCRRDAVPGAGLREAVPPADAAEAPLPGVWGGVLRRLLSPLAAALAVGRRYLSRGAAAG